MARITVEDCLKRIDSQYDLVLLAKERTSQLNAGDKALVDEDNDKNTVISLREIGDGKISLKTLEDSAINKLRKQQEEVEKFEDLEEEEDNDSFDKTYKGEISKSGAAILPSKRVRRMPDKITAEKKKAITNEATEELNDKSKETTEEITNEEDQKLESSIDQDKE